MLETLQRSPYWYDLDQAMQMGTLRLQTVDSSQGSEADIVILSCVRSNADGRIGFVGTGTISRDAPVLSPVMISHLYLHACELVP